jgi:hypothetical protein
LRVNSTLPAPMKATVITPDSVTSVRAVMHQVVALNLISSKIEQGNSQLLYGVSPREPHKGIDTSPERGAMMSETPRNRARLVVVRSA